MKIPSDLWDKMDIEVRNLSDALDLLYVMWEATNSDVLDVRRYSPALNIVWLHLCGIEDRLHQLSESVRMASIEERQDEFDAGAAANEA